MRAALFVSNDRFLEAGGGGVQWCTREYRETLAWAWPSLSTVSFKIDRAPLTRLKRRFFPAPLRHLHSSDLVAGIARRAEELDTRLIFLNNIDAAALAPALREQNSKFKLIYLSHGAELTDVVNNMRLSESTGLEVAASSGWLGDLIKAEIAIRRSIDAVMCISEEDEVFEHWLGAENAFFVPRQIPRSPLNRRPIRGRIGTVATLDHGPNLDGIERLAAAMDRSDELEFRVVGGPAAIGHRLANHHRRVVYLGRLDDEELREEAVTWSLFVNPIFCQARGASTKVATALGWGLPVLTTPFGARGYRWNSKALPLSRTAELLNTECVRFSLGIVDGSERAEAVASLAPTRGEAAGLIVDCLAD